MGGSRSDRWLLLALTVLAAAPPVCTVLALTWWRS
jgi:hypothetical protein